MNPPLTQSEAMQFCRVKKELFAAFIEKSGVRPINIGERTKLYLEEDLIAGLKRIRDTEAQQADSATISQEVATILGEHK